MYMEPNRPTEFDSKAIVQKESLDIEPTSADYEARVLDMHGMLQRGAESEDYWDSLDKVWTEYVAIESDPRWQQFCAALLQAPRLTIYQDRIAELSQAEKNRRLTHEEYTEMHTTKIQVIEDKHYFRSMIENHQDDFTMREFTQWYAMFNGGRSQKATEDIYGAMSEIAAWEAAASLPGLLMAVEYGNAEDDSHGGDIKALMTDSLEEVLIDVKSGLQIPEHRRTKTGYKLVIGVPTQLMDSHGRLDSDGKLGMQRNIEYAVTQAIALKKAQ
jgi:hypothetical protein